MHFYDTSGSCIVYLPVLMTPIEEASTKELVLLRRLPFFLCIQDHRDYKMTSISGGRVVERAGHLQMDRSLEGWSNVWLPSCCELIRPAIEDRSGGVGGLLWLPFQANPKRASSKKTHQVRDGIFAWERAQPQATAVWRPKGKLPADHYEASRNGGSSFWMLGRRRSKQIGLRPCWLV